jgi:hypothetical protein
MSTLTVDSLGQALLDIMALHEPERIQDGGLGGLCCSQCGVPVETEPCPTVQIINAAFGRA